MAKGYWLAHASVTDSEAWGRYIEAARPAFAEYGARFLARGGAAEEMEGGQGRARHVVIEFPSLDAARSCWQSETYQAARNHREAAGVVTITVVEGLE
ncbi:MAG: DUF1330 domain-containing protein [Pseudomonadota bacterium]